MDRPARTELEARLRERHQTLEEGCAAFAAGAAQLRVRATLSPRQFARWMAGTAGTPRPVMHRVARHVWGEDLAVLLGPPRHRGTLATADSCPLTTAEMEATIIMAAQESARHASAAGGGVDDASVEQLHADLTALAARFAATPSATMVLEARQARDAAYRLLDRTRRPAQTRDLYWAAGVACGILAGATFDAGNPAAAEGQARAARTYADLVDHPGLHAWACGTQAMVAYWTDRPTLAVDLAQRGLAGAPAGAAAARLYAIEARAWAHRGDAVAVQEALAAADDAMDAAGDVACVDELGGDYEWPRAQHLACAATALLGVADAGAATARLRQSLDLVGADVGAAARVHLDLAAAAAVGEDLDAVGAALDPVWQLPVQQRRHALTGRLAGLARTLTGARWRREPAAGELRDRIEAYCGDAAAARALAG